MTVKVPIPGSHRAISYNERKYTAFRTKGCERGFITLFDRADPERKMVFSSNAKVAALTSSDVIVDADRSATEAAKIASTATFTKQAWPEKTTLPVDIQGSLGRSRAIIDIFVGPVPKDLHIDVVELGSATEGRAPIMLLQQRALLAYGRSFRDKCFVWNSAAVPAGGFVLFHLPRIEVPSATHRNLVLRVGGCFGDGEPIECVSPVNHLPGEKSLYYPVPNNWRVANTPELLSIHRYAVAIRDRRISVAQRGAMDFNLIDGRPDNTNCPKAYPAFGQVVFAPCNGRVIVADNGHPDMPVGARDEACSRGNQICIRRSDGLVVVLAHLQCGSLNVSRGEIVRHGQPIAKVGNSGRSSEPHLHMHLASSHDSFADGYFFELRSRN